MSGLYRGLNSCGQLWLQETALKFTLPARVKMPGQTMMGSYGTRGLAPCNPSCYPSRSGFDEHDAMPVAQLHGLGQATASAGDHVVSVIRFTSLIPFLSTTCRMEAGVKQRWRLGQPDCGDLC